MFKNTKKIRRALVSKLTANNIFLRGVLGHEYVTGSRIKAIAMMLYLFPVRRKIKPLSGPIASYEVIGKQKYYNELQDLLHISKVEGFELVRLGRDNDGGYIMLNDFPCQNKGIAYSFGISDDVSWDTDMAQKGYDVFMYDHTIEKLPENNSKFHFFRQGIADSSEQIQDERLKTLDYFIEQNKHKDKRNMILKMDVEKAEWGFLSYVSSDTLSRFDQILIEFHGINEPSCSDMVIQALRKLDKTHKVVHIHGQNVGYYISNDGKTFCNQIEVSYARRDKYNFIEDYDVNLPLNIDMPALPYIPEAELGKWNRKVDFTAGNFSITTVRA